MRQKLRMAVQRSGRLAEGSLALLQKCGIKISATKHQLLTQDEEFGIDFIFARDDDIPGLVANGICDIGIIGQNLLSEQSANLNSSEKNNVPEIIMSLGFSKCRLSLGVPKDKAYKSLQDLSGKIIATSYPNSLRSFLAKHQINAQIVEMHGSVELAPQIGVADLICDLVSSGATMSENGLQEFMQVEASEAVLIRKLSALDEQQQILFDRLILRINGVLNANRNKYIMMHIDRAKLPQLAQILPGSESPTILELRGDAKKVAVHVVSPEEVFWSTIENLKELGASSILVLPIEKMIF